MTPSVVLGVIGSDSHVVGITILERSLAEAGFDVVNLGVQTSQQEFVEAAVEHDADAILVSSLYGHAKQDCEGFPARIADSDADPLLYIGGNLAVGQTDFEETRGVFREMGFDRVFGAEASPDDAIDSLTDDLDLGEAERERAVWNA